MLYFDLLTNYVNNNILIFFPTISLSNMYNYTLTPINNVPIFTYGSIGITTIVLATITLLETTDEDKESIFSKLPGFSKNPKKINNKTRKNKNIKDK